MERRGEEGAKSEESEKERHEKGKEGSKEDKEGTQDTLKKIICKVEQFGKEKEAGGRERKEDIKGKWKQL